MQLGAQHIRVLAGSWEGKHLCSTYTTHMQALVVPQLESVTYTSQHRHNFTIIPKLPTIQHEN